MKLHYFLLALVLFAVSKANIIDLEKIEEFRRHLDEEFDKLEAKPSSDASSKKETDVEFEEMFADHPQKDDILSIFKDDIQDIKRGLTNHSSHDHDFVDPCVDERNDCWRLAAHCDLEQYSDKMLVKCRKTCGYCKTCKEDVWQKAKCLKIYDHKYCGIKKYKSILEKNCYSTCFCRIKAPQPCEMDKEGCCWDMKSFAKDGCAACRDFPHVRSLCKQVRNKVEEECMHPTNLPAAWFRKFCSASCGLCSNCHDYRQFKDDCLVWKAKGKCNERKNQIRCPKTCGLCH